MGDIMGLFGKKEEKNDSTEDGDSSAGKYNEQCALCGKAPTNKHFAGQYFHRKCFRRVRKGAKGML